MQNHTQNRIWVNGSFDVMHIGHIRLLKYAASLGIVRIGLDSDDRIQKRKGVNRPFNNLHNRIEFVSSISYVDSVVTFDTDQELEECISGWLSDIIVVGDDYAIENVIGRHLVKDVLFFTKDSTHSTSRILSYESK